jgi:hypothetical protein
MHFRQNIFIQAYYNSLPVIWEQHSKDENYAIAMIPNKR